MNIICIARPTWGGSYQKSTVQLMTELALTNNILYVNPQPTFKDVITTALGRKSELNLSRLIDQESRLEEVICANGASVHILHPRPGLPINWLDNPQSYERWTRFNVSRLLEDIREVMIPLELDEPVVVNAFQPALGVAMKGQLNEQLLLYYCYDEISAAHWCRKHGPRAEQTFLAEADAVITSSQALLEAKRPFAKRAFWVPNGVNFELFNQVVGLREERRITQENWQKQYKLTPRKVVGYIGSIDDRLDVSLIKACAQAMPNTDFWFVGRIVDKAVEQALMSIQNVWLPGSQKPEALPALMAQMDAAIIPFVRNEFTRNIYPLKINEYLAAGLPVVTTPFADLTNFIDTVDIASDDNTFVQCLNEAIKSPDYDLKFRIATAYENDWSRRAKAFMAVINDLLPTNFFEDHYETGICIS